MTGTGGTPQEGAAPAEAVHRGARWRNLALCAVAAFALCAQFALTGTGPGEPLPGTPADPDPGVLVSVIRFFSFFTILSNLLVLISSLPLALGRRLGPLMQVLRVDALVAIVITGVVHWFLLRPLGVASGFPGTVDALLHIVVPVAAVLTWTLGEPRGRITARTVLLALVFPLVYAAWTFAHGAMTGWYPYPFIDVPVTGYPAAIGMAAGVLLAFIVGAVALWGIDVAAARLRRRTIEDGSGGR